MPPYLIPNLVDALIDKIDLGDRPREQPKVKPVELPDAIVLLVVESKCTSCGSEYRSPNSRMLYRYGRSHFAPDKFVERVNELPREVKIHRFDVPACEVCLDFAHFDETIVKRKPISAAELKEAEAILGDPNDD